MSTALERSNNDLGLFDAGPGQMLEVAAGVANQFADIVKQQGMSVRIGQSEHIQNEAWQTIGAMTGCFIDAQGAEVTELPWRREPADPGERPASKDDAELAAWQLRRYLRDAWELGRGFGFKASLPVHRAGAGMGWAEASCQRDEPQWASRPDFQLRSMAQTRAQSKALSMPLRWTVKLAGYATTPAEELDGTPPAPAAPAPPWGPTSDDDGDLKQAAQIVRELGGPLDVDGEAFIAKMGEAFDGIPVACLKMLRGLRRYLSDARVTQHRTAPEDAPPASDVYPPAESGHRYYGD